jgi:hypothetical protein
LRDFFLKQEQRQPGASGCDQFNDEGGDKVAIFGGRCGGTEGRKDGKKEGKKERRKEGKRERGKEGKRDEAALNLSVSLSLVLSIP